MSIRVIEVPKYKNPKAKPKLIKLRYLLKFLNPDIKKEIYSFKYNLIAKEQITEEILNQKVVDISYKNKSLQIFLLGS